MLLILTGIDEFLKNPFIFVDNTGKCKELSEIEYAMTMTAPIMKSIFSDVLDRLKLHWGETMSYVMSDCCRKIDLRFVHKAKGLELSHSECAKVPTPAKAVHDRSKFLQTLKGVLDNLLKEDLSDDEVQNSKILGNQFAEDISMFNTTEWWYKQSTELDHHSPKLFKELKLISNRL
ncbi:10456_t:CDS:2 [Entrophospora sp. SA101]|nr:10456_t:CDS:2 [Entrophospora sp. SA101]